MRRRRRRPWRHRRRRFPGVVDCVAERRRIGPPILRLLLERAPNGMTQRRWKVVPHRREWTWRFRHVLHEHGRRVRCLEWRFAGEHLIPNHAERIDVAPSVQVTLTERLLRRHVRRRADRNASDGEPRIPLRRARDAEVGHHRTACRAVEHDVVRLHVAVDDALRVGIRKRVGDDGEDAACLTHGQARLAREPLRKALTVHERHHEVHDAFAFVDRINGNDARMCELRRGLRLPQEPLANVGVERELGRQHLDRDSAVKPEVGRAIDDRHPASADLRVDEVLRPDRDHQTVEQVVGHPRSARRELDIERPPRRSISSATRSASSTFSATRMA